MNGVIISDKTNKNLDGETKGFEVKKFQMFPSQTFTPKVQDLSWKSLRITCCFVASSSSDWKFMTVL